MGDDRVVRDFWASDGTLVTRDGLAGEMMISDARFIAGRDAGGLP
jgi:hypothetical protein